MEIATEKELDARQVQYDAWIDKETKCSTRKSEIQEVLNFENYLGSELYGEFCSYRRDQDYSNDNYISDGLNNTDLFSNAREFIKTAQEELKKAATLQCNISCKVKNLFALDEFKPFWDSFQIGNWITVGYDNEYYRLRVISINGSLSDFSNIDVEFSSVTRISNVTTNIKDVLNQAQSMATNYSYISRQSNNGQKANDTLSEFQKKSINAALYMIKNNDEEGITIDNHGITARAWNDILGDFDPEQLIITHNVLGFTDDNFASLKTALGKVLMPDGTYKYGLNAEVVIGTFLLGKYLELENENGSLKFNGDGFVITNGINTFTVNPNNKEKLLSLSSNNVDVFYVDSNGKLHIQGDGAGLDITSNKTITDMSTKISQTADAIQTEVINRQNADSDMSTKISQTAHSVSISASGSGNTAGITIALYDENGNIIDTEKTANITITGFVSFFDLANSGSTTINGANITTGTINCDLLNGGTIRGQKLEGCRAEFDDGADSLRLKYSDDYYMGLRAGYIYCHHNNPGYIYQSIVFDNLMKIGVNSNADCWGNGSGSLEPTYYMEINKYGGINFNCYNLTKNNSAIATVSDIPKVPDLSNYINSVGAPSWTEIGSNNWVVTSFSLRAIGSSIHVSGNRIKKNLSDQRLKEHLGKLDERYADFYKMLNPIIFKFHDDIPTIKGKHFGLYANEVADALDKANIDRSGLRIVWQSEVDSEAHEDRYVNDKTWNLDYDELHALHIYMIQGQQKEIEQLKSDNFALKGEVDILKQRLGKMEEMLNVINSKIN